MNIYELLKKKIVVNKNSLTSSIFYDEENNMLDSKKDKEIFELIKNISSIGVEITSKEISYHPSMVFEDKRTFAIEDLSENDFSILLSLDLNEIPLNLRAHIADILWTQKKDYKSALTAAASYLELFKSCYSEKVWIGTLDMIKRAICISAQTVNKEIYEEACGMVYDEILKLDGKDEGFLSLRLLNIILRQKYGDINKLLKVVENIIVEHCSDVAKVEQAYNIKIICLGKLNEKEKIRDANLELAEYYVDFAEQIVEENIQGAMRAEQYLQKSIKIYRNNGETAKGNQVHRRLVEVQNEITQLMIPINTEIDNSVLIANIDTNMVGLTFEESLIRLIQLVPFPKKEDIKKKLCEDYRDNPISHMFENKLVNSTGQIILSLKPLNYNNPEENEELLNMHLQQRLLQEQNVIGNNWLKYLFQYIRNKNSFMLSDLDFLTYNNPIIPKGRERIFRSAIYMILNGQNYEAMHILAPQVENLFRTIAKEVGGLTVTLENDGTSKEKVLSSIFDLPELLDCYNNDLLFIFKGLLNEQSGANIRNEIAHGIVSEASANSGAYIYFAGAVIKLLSYTSISCLTIIKNSTKLNTFIEPPQNAVKIKFDN